jgi:dTDP-4-dehydrorhamnose reductase
MRVFLIGANGQLGTDLSQVLSAQGQELIPSTHAQLDICDFERTSAVIADARPDAIINTAAFHRVDECEKDVARSFLVNSVAVGHLASVAALHRAILVHFSTDYVFGGTDRKRHSETDRCDPVNVYGASKAAGELLVSIRSARYFIVRTCGLYGLAGSSGKGGNFVETMLRKAREGSAIRVVEDQFVTPTHTLELAHLVCRLLTTTAWGCYHLSSEGECSWYEFAREIFALSGTKADLAPVPSSQFPTPARRPAYSVLSKSKFQALGIATVPHWRSSLADYLQRRATAVAAESAALAT